MLVRDSVRQVEAPNPLTISMSTIEASVARIHNCS